MVSPVPPEKPPLTSYAVTESSIDASGPRTAFTYRFDTNTRRSGGMEPNPQAGTINAFVLDAIKSYLQSTPKRVEPFSTFTIPFHVTKTHFVATSATKCGSGLRST